MIQTIEKPILITLAVDSNDAGSGWKTVLFNCNCHTFDAVITQIIRAIQCTREKANDLAYCADRTGSAIIYNGSRERCEKIAKILGNISLNVTVIQ